MSDTRHGASPHHFGVPAFVLSLLGSTHTSIHPGGSHIWTGSDIRCALSTDSELEQQGSWKGAISRNGESRVFVISRFSNRSHIGLGHRIKQTLGRPHRNSENHSSRLEVAHSTDRLDL